MAKAAQAFSSAKVLLGIMDSDLKEPYMRLTAEKRHRLFRLQIPVVVMAFAQIAAVVSIGPFKALAGNIDQLRGSRVAYIS